jgi:hypothetical protein
LRSVDNGMSHAGAFVAPSRVSCKGEIGDQNFRVSALPPNLGQRMTAMGRSRQFDGGLANDPYRRKAAVRPRSGECPFTLPLQTSINANR